MTDLINGLLYAFVFMMLVVTAIALIAESRKKPGDRHDRLFPLESIRDRKIFGYWKEPTGKYSELFFAIRDAYYEAGSEEGRTAALKAMRQLSRIMPESNDRYLVRWWLQDLQEEEATTKRKREAKPTVTLLDEASRTVLIDDGNGKLTWTSSKGIEEMLLYAAQKRKEQPFSVDGEIDDEI